MPRWTATAPSYQVFWHVALPVALPVSLMGGIVFSFVLVWNELMIALALTSSKSMTLPRGGVGLHVDGPGSAVGVVNASTALLALPPLLPVGPGTAAQLHAQT